METAGQSPRADMTNEPKPAAWMHPDGRVVPASTMAAAQRDGGAMKSSLLGYSVRLYDQAVIDAKDAEIEALRKDAARLDWLETLLHRTEYQNQRRPAESVSSDMHFAHGNCNLYVRNLFGNATTGAGGGGDSVRAAIDAAMMKAKT